ncbi:Polysaccharide biosynthesis protein [Candidatus Magnetoovum chiemensis]|nr:Polysaccharide biosynthesis protein [Candidatus Magnetoovum chiemensis]
MSLTRKTASAIKWSMFFTVLEPLSTFVFSILLYHILKPEDFGLYAIVNISLAFIRMSQDIGLMSALIQRKDLDNLSMSTGFWGMFIFSIFLFIFTCAISRIIANFYNNEQLRLLIIVSSIIIIINALYSIHRIILLRELNIKLIRLFTFLTGIISSVVCLSLAYSGFGVWSLVWSSIISGFITMLLYWWRVQWKPEIEFKWEVFKDLLGFGFNSSGDKIIGFVKKYVDQLIIGKYLGMESLGYYSFGFKSMNRPLNIISNTFIQTLLPAFSLVQNENERIKRGYLKIIHYVSCMILPAMSGISVLAPMIIEFIYGEKWLPAVNTVRIFCIVGVTECFSSIASRLFYAKGLPQKKIKKNTYIFVLYLPLMIFIVKMGLIKIALLVAVTSLVIFIIIQISLNRIINISWYEFFKALSKPVLISFIMIFVVIIMKSSLANIRLSGHVSLFLLVFSGFVSYTVGIIFINGASIKELLNVFNIKIFNIGKMKKTSV